MVIDLSGRTAVITGGSKGLGLACAKQFAQAGAQVAIIGRDKKTLAEAAADIHSYHADARVTQVQADMSKPEDIQWAFQEIIGKHKSIDILMNNVGASAAKPFTEITDEEWTQDFELKLFSAVRFTRLVWPAMQERKWGRIINTLAIAAKTPRAGSAPSSVTRAAGLALTKVLANEGAPHGILVNAMLVGLIESDQWVRKAEASGRSVDDVLTELGKQVPLGRAGTGEEFANLALFLASEKASFITGTAINVDGGMSPIT